MKERKDPAAAEKTLGRRITDNIDRAILAVAPRWGGRRIAARKTFEAAESREARLRRRVDEPRNEGSIEGANSDRLRGSRWLGSRLSTDSELELDLPTLRLRSTDLYQSDALGGAIDNRACHEVGTGFTPRARIDFEELGIDKKKAKKLNRQVEKKFKRWAKRADRDRKHSFWQITRLADREWARTGDAFVVMSDVGDTDSLIPLCLEVVDAERVETPPEHQGNPLVRMGIEKDNKGKIVAYWIRQTHPADTLENNFKYDRVEASRVCHVFERLFAGQSRGLPWMWRALNSARDIKDGSEAAMIAMQVQACYAAFIEQDPTMLGGMTGYQNATGAASGSFTNGQRYEETEFGSLRYLNPGEKVNFADPSQPGANFDPMMVWSHRRVSGAMNYPYELLTRDWRGLSFAGGRLVLQDARVAWSCNQKFLRELLLEMVWNRAVEELVIAGEIDIDLRAFSKNREAWLEHDWTPPRWPFVITPKEEVEADILEVQNNLATAEEKIAGRGGDYDDVMDRRQMETEDQRDREIEPGRLEAEGAAAANPQPTGAEAI